MISNSPFDRLRARRRTPVRGMVVVAAVVIVVGLAVLFRAPLTTFFWSVIGPVMTARYAIGPDASTAALLADRETLYQENLDLKARLGRTDTVPVRILASVILRPPSTPYDTLMIDAGAGSGVAQGDLVSAGGTALIGTVTHVYEHTARVTLFSAPGETYDALLRGVTPVSIGGEGGGSLVGAMPAGTAVKAGDTVLVPGIAGGLVAKVAHVERVAGESQVTVYFTLPVNPFELRFVEVWKRQ